MSAMDFKLLFATVFVFFLAVTERIFRLVYDLVPYPFIDEAFHVPQAVKYCNGSFHEWDPKITTLPGLYLFSMITHRLFGLASCNLYSLRYGNVALAGATFILIYRLLRRMKVNQKGYSRKVVLWHAINLSIFPVSYFFTFLYYTDTLSTTLVLLMVDMHLSSRKNIASLVGILACVVRQVNIVWVGYLLLHSFSKSVNDYLSEPSLRNTMKQLRKKNTLVVLWSSKVPSDHLVRMAQRIIEDTYSYIGVCCLFVAFVAYNKGIVVGDRSAHEPVIHLPQLLYFSAFFLFFSLPYNLPKIGPFLKFVSKNQTLAVCCSLSFAAVIYYNTHIHPYLLADNRHLTFYLWNKLLRKDVVKFLVVPIYVFGSYCLYDNIEGTNYELATWIALKVALVPQRLLEFRYFIIPYYICRFHVKNNNYRFLLAESVLNVAINAAVLGVFSQKQFYWADFEHPQRIIW
ncbi:Asparagine-linked glycosylation 10, alpha-1,2-glucosyltransferase homolog [Nesidiocoris tenuis]|uniref:Dol-P-Glc:Glc(2)Man(9)GlcNAc(2)-PP-Dol alpha-1,2-glucosyltransferase n=1 Tax=Nesidiocoris tenuis TaxID=355587 RepID=A0ABN7B2B4_9HEMI|nr:Asparagine-linked glycosylation 10, alpha-1,2-glucosyltransferase homolog [Nesidiocoris tenuis]